MSATLTLETPFEGLPLEYEPHITHIIAEYDDSDTEEWEEPNIDHIETEDDTPVDNLPSEKQQRLLTEPLYSSDSWSQGHFLASANVGIFRHVHQPPIVPDMFLSLDVQVAENWWEKKHRSYFLWEFGKPPEVVVEIVSNKKGGELNRKVREYTRLGVMYYVVYDPQQFVQKQPLVVYELHVGNYFARQDMNLAEVGLSLTLWTGVFEQQHDTWLRWADPQGHLILTGAERAALAEIKAEKAEMKAEEAEAKAEEAEAKAEEAEAKAEAAEMKAEQERQRVEKLLAQLKTLGIEPTA